MVFFSSNFERNYLRISSLMLLNHWTNVLMCHESSGKNRLITHSHCEWFTFDFFQTKKSVKISTKLKCSNNSNVNLILAIRFVPQYNFGSMCTLAVTMVPITPSEFYQPQYSCKIHTKIHRKQTKGKTENKIKEMKGKNFKGLKFGTMQPTPKKQTNMQKCYGLWHTHTHKNKRTVKCKDCGYRFIFFISFVRLFLFLDCSPEIEILALHVLTEFSFVIKNTCSIAS